jgi:hypothetical protein
MKQSALIALIIGLSFILFGKVLKLTASPREEIKWDFVSIQTDDKFFEIHLRATIDQPWHIYSQHEEEGQIPRPTKVVFLPNPMIKLIGKPAEQGDLIEKLDPELGIQRYYEDNVIFIQPVKLKDTKTPIAVKGIVHYQVCTGHQCKTPATKEFSVVLEAQTKKQ